MDFGTRNAPSNGRVSLCCHLTLFWHLGGRPPSRLGNSQRQSLFLHLGVSHNHPIIYYNGRKYEGEKCQKIKLSSGNTVVLFTLGIKVGNFQETGETYVYDISAGTFERKSLWDFPNALITGTTQSHAIDNRMVLRTARGTFLFKDNETSTDTSSHWFKIDDWGFGQSAPFNLRYVIP